MIKHYLIRLKNPCIGDITDIYAIGTDKKQLKRFLRYRNPDKLTMDIIELNIHDSELLVLNHGYKNIREYSFVINGVYITIPITDNEMMRIEGASYQMECELTASSKLNPSIFTSQVKHDLKTIGYNRFYSKWMVGILPKEDMYTSNFILSSFINKYQELLNMSKLQEEICYALLCDLHSDK